MPNIGAATALRTSSAAPEMAWIMVKRCKPSPNLSKKCIINRLMTKATPVPTIKIQSTLYLLLAKLPCARVCATSPIINAIWLTSQHLQGQVEPPAGLYSKWHLTGPDRPPVKQSRLGHCRSAHPIKYRLSYSPREPEWRSCLSLMRSVTLSILSITMSRCASSRPL